MDIDDLELAKRRYLSQLLIRCARLVDERAFSRLPREDYPNFRRAHLALFPHIAFEGTRLTEIASAMDTSKQAVFPLIKELEGWGVLERCPDPEDGRAKLVRFTEQGRAQIAVGLGILGTVDRELEGLFGQGRASALLEMLQELQDALENGFPIS